MVSNEILMSHPVSTLKKEISKTNIKGYSKLDKAGIVTLMMKNKERFGHIKMNVKSRRSNSAAEQQAKREARKAAPKKEAPKKEDIKAKVVAVPKAPATKFTFDRSKVETFKPFQVTGPYSTDLTYKDGPILVKVRNDGRSESSVAELKGGKDALKVLAELANERYIVVTTTKGPKEEAWKQLGFREWDGSFRIFGGRDTNEIRLRIERKKFEENLKSGTFDDRKGFSFDPSKIKREGDTITYKDKNVLINGRIEDDRHFMLDLFRSRSSMDQPRAPKGEAHSDLCSLIRHLENTDALRGGGLIRLKAGDITRGERRFSMKKLVEYYKSIGFKPVRGGKTKRTTEMEQRISDFLRICRNKFK